MEDPAGGSLPAPNSPLKTNFSLSLSFSAPSRPQMFRDPRFDDLSGEYKPEIFEKTYKFIDDIRSREKHVRNRERRGEGGKEGERETLMSAVCLLHQLVQKKLKKLKTNGQKREELSFLLKRMVSSSTSWSEALVPLPCDWLAAGDPLPAQPSQQKLFRC